MLLGQSQIELQVYLQHEDPSLYCDVNISSLTIEALKSKGYDITA